MLLVIAFISLSFFRVHHHEGVELDMNKLGGDLKPQEIFYFEEAGLGNFTCTGMTYDSKNDTFWIADYGALPGDSNLHPRLIEMKSDFTETVTILDISNLVDKKANIQGICYDEHDDMIWIATGKSIVKVSKSGEKMSSFSLGSYERCMANGICVDDGGNLWCLCYTEYLIKYSREGKCIEKYAVNFKSQDHIYYSEGKLLLTVGADYNGNDNFVMVLNPQEVHNYSLYRLIESYSVEGVCIKDDFLYIANDGFFHDAKINKSYVCKYYLNEIE